MRPVLSKHSIPSFSPPSQVHPRFKSLPPLHTTMWLGRDDAGRWRRDPLAIGFDEELG